MKLSPAREAALRFLSAQEREPGDWDARLAAVLDGPRLQDARDRRLFSQLVAGVTRLRGRLDARLLRLTGRARLDAHVRQALRLALFQLEHMDRLPAHAVIGEAVEWVKRKRGRKLAGWTNAQLRAWQREGVPGADPDPEDAPLDYAEQVLSQPRWLAELLIAEHGREAAFTILAALNQHPGPCFRWNALRSGREDFLAGLAAAGLAPAAVPGLPAAFRLAGAWPPELRAALGRGDLSVQEAASQHIGRLLTRGESGDWADLCAAPGGKCCHLAELGGDARVLLALDRDAARLEKVVANAARLGLTRIRTLCVDARHATPQAVDGVLLDAPCSALGVLAANPDARWRKEAEQVPRLASRQRELLAAAARWPRAGGRLLYAVCTLTPAETREQRDWFLAAHPEFEHEPIGADELPPAFVTPAGDYLVLPGPEEPVGMYAFRCRRRGNKEST